MPCRLVGSSRIIPLAGFSARVGCSSDIIPPATSGSSLEGFYALSKTRPRLNSFVSVKDGSYYTSRGATLLHDLLSCSYRNTIILLTTDVCLTSHHTRHIKPLCKYCGSSVLPFHVPSAAHLTNCVTIRFSASRTLCACMNVFIPASSV